MRQFFVFITIICGTLLAVHAERGVIDSCGDAAHSFEGWWDPNPVVTYQNVAVQIQFVPAVSAKNLNAAVSIIYDGINIFNGKKIFPCSQLPVCPIVAAKPTVESITMPLNYGAPKGHYVIRVNVTNDDGEQLICAVINTHVVHSSRFEQLVSLLSFQADKAENMYRSLFQLV